MTCAIKQNKRRSGWGTGLRSTVVLQPRWSIFLASLKCEVTITQNPAIFQSHWCFSILLVLCHHHFFYLIKSLNINVETIKEKFKFIYYIFLTHSWVPCGIIWSKVNLLLALLGMESSIYFRVAYSIVVTIQLFKIFFNSNS